MDVQGSQYHLAYGRSDWGGCTDPAFGETLATLWQDAEGPATTLPTSWEYDDDGRVLRLRRDTPLFRRAGRTDPLDPEVRRGADVDADGTTYWIDGDRRGIRRRGGRASTSVSCWSVDDLAAACTCDVATDTSGFASTCTCGPVDMLLAALCITTHDHLLAGYVATDESGLLVFDLRAGGAPLRLPWPAGDLDPWDLVATPAGGALLLDRTHGTSWRLDDHLRLRGTVPDHAIGFAPVGGGAPIEPLSPALPAATPVLDANGQSVHPISVENGPGGSALFLESDPGLGHSRILCYDDETLRWETSLEDSVEVVDPADPNATPVLYSVLGHDLVHRESGGPLSPPMLYVADAQGEQVVAYTLDPVSGEVHSRDDFLPLRRWPGRALIGAEEQVWYDFDQAAETRWLSLQVFTECRFDTTATLQTPLDFDDPGVQGAPFDSRTPGCVWHRLLLDAHLPTGTSIAVRARACDDAATLLALGWLSQPVPYLRSGGSELPYADPWADWRGDLRDPVPLPDGMGTHELLFQGVAGRYLQLEVTVTGPARSTPLLRSLRAWFPRFSYVEHYLPAVYGEHDLESSFLERWLANPEGLFTALEERIEHSHVLLDPRTTQAADLPWLAAWFGLVLEPQWDEARRRFLIRHVDRFYRLRGTPAGLVATLRVYLQDAVDESVFCGDNGLGGIRLVERFLTRDTGGAAYGAPAGEPDPDPLTRVQRTAHRFDVLVPLDLADDQVAMVERIVALARPAHAAFALRRYYELFVVGQARLGMDTELGQGPAYRPTVTGSTSLAAGYLGYPSPFDLPDRVVSDLDRVGLLPAL
jgi:phage tail-like protein